MFLLQTLSEYLENPMGKGSTALAGRNIIKTDLDNRYQKLIETHKDFHHSFYYDDINFYAYIEIPSESKRNNTYDVVIQFIPPDKDTANDVNLNNYVIKVFSNCPSFTYTYAYVYNDYGMMIDFLKDKYRDIVLENNPIIKNPGEVINFEKSIYFACKYLKANKRFLNKVALVPVAKKMDIEKFSKIIRATDRIDLEIKREENRLRAEKQSAEKIKKPDISHNNIKRGIDKIAGTKKAKTRSDHKITPHAKIKGKPKVKSTIKK